VVEQGPAIQSPAFFSAIFRPSSSSRIQKTKIGGTRDVREHRPSRVVVGVGNANT
jgi:hypothetical protein